MKKHIFATPCFDPVKRDFKRRGLDFDEYVSRVVHPVHGDLDKQGLDLSPEDR